jgi:hypothetical protein
MAEPPPVLRVARSRANLLRCYLKSKRTEVYGVLLLPPDPRAQDGPGRDWCPAFGVLGLAVFVPAPALRAWRDSPSLGARPWWSKGRGRKPSSGCQFACGSCPRPHHRTFQRWRVSRAERRCLGYLTRGRFVVVVVVVGRPAATCSSVASQHFGADVLAARSAIGQTWMRGDRGRDVPSVLPASSSS